MGVDVCYLVGEFGEVGRVEEDIVLEVEVLFVGGGEVGVEGSPGEGRVAESACGDDVDYVVALGGEGF